MVSSVKIQNTLWCNKSSTTPGWCWARWLLPVSTSALKVVFKITTPCQRFHPLASMNWPCARQCRSYPFHSGSRFLFRWASWKGRQGVGMIFPNAKKYHRKACRGSTVPYVHEVDRVVADELSSPHVNALHSSFDHKHLAAFQNLECSLHEFCSSVSPRYWLLLRSSFTILCSCLVGEPRLLVPTSYRFLSFSFNFSSRCSRIAQTYLFSFCLAQYEFWHCPMDQTVFTLSKNQSSESRFPHVLT